MFYIRCTWETFFADRLATSVPLSSKTWHHIWKFNQTWSLPLKCIIFQTVTWPMRKPA